ncbi:hypothetical protein J4E90_003663 [Alternaria incomplexa]|uniref:uncharacterized protein n=1 Tax=Alternaria incomplexa TaxID=1187928 RepID=UPI002221040F|nr:uncharacterized protein J4E90_003663 [Alternaria incomplexa]KAI4917156.1 hypothetical protein J4E90_003663 [Alternaria incomplexa]
MSPKVNTAGLRPLQEIAEEANMCATSQLAFGGDDEALAQLEARIEELNAEYEQALDGQSGKDKEHGPADAHSNEREEHDEQNPAGHCAQGRNGPAGLRELVNAHEMAVKKSIDGARNMIGAFPSAVDLLPVYNNMRSAVQHPNQVAGGTVGQTPRRYGNHRRQVETHSLSHTDTALPSATRADDQSEEQSVKKKWSTVKVKSGDDDGNSPTADRPNLHSTFFDTFVWPTELSTTLTHARAATRAFRSPLPELRTFEDVHRQIREQDVETILDADNMATLHWVKRELGPVSSSSGPAALQPESATSLLDRTHPKKNAPSQSSLEALCGVHTGQDHNVNCITLKEGISPIDLLNLLDNSDISDIEFEIEDDCAEVKNGDATAGTTTLEPRKFVPTVTEHDKQARVSVEGLNYGLSTDGEEYSDSDADSIPDLFSMDNGLPEKSSDVETATGSASADSTPAPDDAMVDEFLDFTANAFSRDEVFEILRMCGANLVVAVSMYRNARSLDHIRQMLRAWLAPLENAGLGEMDRQSIQDGVMNPLMASDPSQAFSPVHNDEPTGTTMGVRDADRFKVLRPLKDIASSTEEDESKKDQDKAKNKTGAVRAASSAISDGHGGSGGPRDPLWAPSSWEYECNDLAWLINPNSAPGNPGSTGPGPQSSGDDAWASIGNLKDSNNAPEPEAPVSTDYTVTYWATVESGDKTVHIPINSSDVFGSEKNIIESSTGMKKIWKWAQEKGLSDKISLEDAFDLAKDMHCKDETDQPVIKKPERATEAPRATHRSRSRSRSPYARRAAPAVGLLGVNYVYPNPPCVRPIASLMSPVSPAHEDMCDEGDGWSCY